MESRIKMPAYEDWLLSFLDYLRESGLSPGQLARYLPGCEYDVDARRYYNNGVDPGNAAMRELLG